jgi:hypothetical protein
MGVLLLFYNRYFFTLKHLRAFVVVSAPHTEFAVQAAVYRDIFSGFASPVIVSQHTTSNGNHKKSMYSERRGANVDFGRKIFSNE